MPLEFLKELPSFVLRPEDTARSRAHGPHETH